MEELLDDYELENVNELEYAGFWTRFAASFIDGIIITIPLQIFQYLSGLEDTDLFINLLNIVAYWLYSSLQESSESQATIGKKALGIKVVDNNGERISFGKATGRSFGKYISMFILFIGYIMAGFTEKKQALHDIMDNTLVIKS